MVGETKLTRFRAIIREDDASMLAHTGGGAVETAWRTVEFECPQLAAIMAAPVGSYCARQIVGVELICEALKAEADHGR
jgi:hypothetical protein